MDITWGGRCGSVPIFNPPHCVTGDTAESQRIRSWSSQKKRTDFPYRLRHGLSQVTLLWLSHQFQRLNKRALTPPCLPNWISHLLHLHGGTKKQIKVGRACCVSLIFTLTFVHAQEPSSLMAVSQSKLAAIVKADPRSEASKPA